MRAICLYLHVHQPVRYRQYSIFDVGNTSNYYTDNFDGRQSNERIFKKVAEKSYHPMLDLIEKNLKKYPDFKVSFSITGTWLEQAEKWDKSLITQLRRMVASGQVDLQSIFAMDYESGKALLKTITGVGDKVADCVLLFAYHKTEAFPSDVWIKRIVAEYYADGLPECMGEYKGIAQQYLFEYFRNKS